jgi:hypothetical protein
VYWVAPSRLRSVIILCSTIFGMLIVSSQLITEIILGDNYLSHASQLSHWLLRYAYSRNREATENSTHIKPHS